MLPQTGEIVVKSLPFIGIALILLVIVFFILGKKKKKKEEDVQELDPTASKEHSDESENKEK